MASHHQSLGAFQQLQGLEGLVRARVDELRALLDAGLVEGSLGRDEQHDESIQQFWKSMFQLEARADSDALRVAVLALAKRCDADPSDSEGGPSCLAHSSLLPS